MENELNIAKIDLSLDNGGKVSSQLQFSNAQLVINDTLISKLLTQNGINGPTVKTCHINLGANNIAVSIRDYTLTETIYFSAFYDMPSNISIFQSIGTNVHIVNQKIDLLQLDCQTILLAECQIRQLDVGISEHHKALMQLSKEQNPAIPTAHKMKSLDVRGCHIETLKSYIECDNVNIQESFIHSLCFYGGFGSSVPATIKRLNIWNYSEIGVCEIYCTITEFIVSSSSISNAVAKAKCKIETITVIDAEILNAHNFNKQHFPSANLTTWSLISKSAKNDNNSSLKAEANYQIAKETYTCEKCLNKIIGALFGFCTGYGYKPMRIIWAFIALVIGACSVLSIKFLITYGCIPLEQFLKYLAISIAAIAGQSGLSLKDGFTFWIATTEYLAGVILFAMFVNALYVRYKD